jgi:hypothetical protein
MKSRVSIFAGAAILLQTNVIKADEAFLSQVESRFSSSQPLQSPSAIAVPVSISADLDAAEGANLTKQNIFQVAQHGTDSSSIGAQIGGGNLSIISQQGAGNKVIISQRNAR